MPLQKPPPKSQRVTNRNPPADKQTLKHRRRTLQTISELAPQHVTSQTSTGTLSRRDNGSPVHDSYGNPTSKSTQASRRRSLPTQWSTSQRSCTGTPSILVNPTATPRLHRSLTDTSNWKGSARNNPRRRSIPCSFESRGRSLSPVAEGELLRHPTDDDSLRQLEPSRNQSRRKQSVHASHEKEQQERGWNAQRERELIKREQALLEANPQREREHVGLNVGNSSNLPSLTPFPIMKASASRYYSHPFLSNQPMAIDSTRRNSRSRYGRQVNESIISDRLFQDPGISQLNAATELRRSLSATSDLRWLPYNEIVTRTISPTMRSLSSSSLISTTPTERPLSDPRSSSSLQASSNSTRSSSVKSSGSGTSSATRPSQRSSSTYVRTSDHPLRQNPVLNHRESFPVLTEANLETGVPPPTTTHAFLSGQRTAQATHSRGTPVAQDSASSSFTSFLPRELPRRPSRSQTGPSAFHIQKAIDATDVIYRENPDKRRLAGRGPSREEVDEMQKRAAQEKVKERVRRANELEEEKEKELVKEGKKKGSRGFLCGLLGKA